MATQPDLRIGDLERNATAAELSEHYARGRLTLEELNQRLDATFAARTQADLNRIIEDLPHVRSGGAPLPSARTARGPRRPGAALATAWPAGGGASGGPSGSGAYSGRRVSGAFATLLTLLAVLASWLILYTLLPTMSFAWPGKLGLLVAVFTLIRGLLGRIFRGARRRR